MLISITDLIEVSNQIKVVCVSFLCFIVLSYVSCFLGQVSQLIIKAFIYNCYLVPANKVIYLNLKALLLCVFIFGNDISEVFLWYLQHNILFVGQQFFTFSDVSWTSRWPRVMFSFMKRVQVIGIQKWLVDSMIGSSDYVGLSVQLKSIKLFNY